ncbi:M35 family metallo-endopeptidase [Cupriavidus basilensis]|uniref:M35 family metallo-endopeptidase n=1 Tax=Cupriavidus basilensis TaxID=68895 RepID=UPI0009E55BE2|nr:M35 family metallo-endopeptidase [Cupriavidus basilensis]
MRAAIRHGDATNRGGKVFATGGIPHHGVEVAAEGDQATCPACNSIGTLFNDAYPAFTLTDGRQILVEGAWLKCKCATHPRVIASQSDFRIAIRRPLSEAHLTQAGPLVPSHRALSQEASNKLIERMQDDTYAEDQTIICPNMSNAEFRALMLRLRDKAVKDVDNRLGEISTWGKIDQAKMALYFGPPSNELRTRLKDGLARIRALLVSLSENNFERYSEESLARTGCIPKAAKDNLGAASVCGPDGLHRIFIWPAFCRLPDELKDSKGVPVDGDSKLLTLIHEVSHFQDAMGTRDVWYSTRNSRWKAADANRFCIENAENIAAYTVGIWDDRI